MGGSRLLLCNRPLTPIPPAANPLCNQSLLAYFLSPGAGNAAPRFHQSRCWFSHDMAARGARATGDAGDRAPHSGIADRGASARIPARPAARRLCRWRQRVDPLPLLPDAPDFVVAPLSYGAPETRPLFFVLGGVSGLLAIAYNNTLPAPIAAAERLKKIARGSARRINWCRRRYVRVVCTHFDWRGRCDHPTHLGQYRDFATHSHCLPSQIPTRPDLICCQDAGRFICSTTDTRSTIRSIVWGGVSLRVPGS